MKHKILSTVVCLSDLPEDPSILAVNAENTVLKITTVRRWENGKVVESKREYSAS